MFVGVNKFRFLKLVILHLGLDLSPNIETRRRSVEEEKEAGIRAKSDVDRDCSFVS